DASVANLTDTTITAPAAGHLLRWNGSKWVNVTLVAADIPALDWSKITTGKPTTLAGYGITDAVQKANTSATFSPAAGAWHRIAASTVGIGRNSGRFAIDWAVSGNHGSVRLTAACHYGQPGSVSIQQLEYGAYGAGGIVEARIVYHTVESGNYAYLEVKFAAALSNVAVSVEGSDLLGWTLLAPNTAGSVPAGYSSYTHGFVAMSQIAAGTYRSVTVNQEGRVTAGTNPTTLAGYGITDASVANLTDTTITAPAAGHLLRWNGSKWVNVTLVAADIPALDWSKIGSGKPTTLAGYGITDASVANLTDTTITAPAAGHLLRWNGSKWVNVTLVAADIPA
ncbi:hypothetical protein, partial [Crenobacter luteus]|uniref:hypothetical protein n=1 Tax=Crenobacter luteus TaxID=1452487 RepID=UPI001A9EA014